MKFKYFLREFKEDLGKKCIAITGLPASGKSYFLTHDIKKWFPDFISYKTINSDVQVLRTQYSIAKNHFIYLSKFVKNEDDYKKFVDETIYIANDGTPIKISLSYNEIMKNIKAGFDKYFSSLYKIYYASYFDFRDLAKNITSELFKDKIKKTARMVIIDTVGANAENLLSKLEETKKENFLNIIIYLQINPELSIKRDKYRQEHYGRGVGENVIIDYSKKIDNAFHVYQQEGSKPNGIVDRLMHFNWIPEGNSPIHGNWQLISDNKYYINRKLQK